VSTVDRRALVARHSPVVSGIGARSPLSVGNGELCFTVDITGLQSIPAAYPLAGRYGGADGTMLGTQAQWGWHSSPGPYSDKDLLGSLREYRTPHGPVPYVDMHEEVDPHDGTPAERWLRANPHRLDLARVSLVTLADSSVEAIGPDRISAPHQRLDLWSGVLESTFDLDGHRVDVTTACHPQLDMLAVRVRAAQPLAGRLAVRLAFSYGSEDWSNAAGWAHRDAHTTRLDAGFPDHHIERRLDDSRYAVTLAAPASTVVQSAAHEVVVGNDGKSLDLVVGFAAEHSRRRLPSVEDVLGASREHWPRFWMSGAAVELAQSKDRRAPELERRIVLSQYLTAIQCAGSMPPQETGLTANSWRGRFHLEMHWWHAAHFALWGRAGLLERSLGWYFSALPAAQETAQRQGLQGARWPKQVGPNGRESPSSIGPFLLWQQPHPIYLAELVRRAAPDARSARRVVERYYPIVEQSASFMSDVVAAGEGGYELGPPLVPAQESYAATRADARNPTFELAYWSWALDVACRWRRLHGGEPDPRWAEVSRGMARPRIRNDTYAALDVAPYTVRTDHPSMLYALGFVPPTPLIEPDTMRRTLYDVLSDWEWDSTWGWDFPAIAMTAARVGEPGIAVDALLMPVAKNRHLPNGHNFQTGSLPLYLPGNGGLLAAVALMAGGWDGAGGGSAPGFPQDGSWTVRHEGFVRSP
jgi:hypothetical protein